MNLKENLSKQAYASLQEICSSLLSIFVNSIKEDGSLGANDADVLTHHFLLIMETWKDRKFSRLVDRSLEWFNNLDDYREKKETDFNPFKLIALSVLNKDESKNYLAEKISAIKKFHVKADGYAVIQLGFSNSGDVAEVFPTLVAIELLVINGNRDSLELAEKSLNWCKKQIDSNTVYQNLFSILGYIALILVKYEKASGDKQFNSWRESLVKKLMASQEHGLWENNVYQSAYIFYDLAFISTILQRTDVEKTVLNFIKLINNDFFKNEDVSGQNFFLVSSSLLRAFGLIFEPDDKVRIIDTVIDDSLKKSAELVQRKQVLELHSRFYRKFMDDVNEKNFIMANPPIFKARNVSVKKNQVFVLMPFGEKVWIVKDNLFNYKQEKYDFDRPFKTLIEPTIKEMGLECKRADSIFAPHPFMEKIWRQINESALIISDLTSNNPNVLYELGIAHTLGKPIILLAQDSSYVPTDLKAIEFIEYDNKLGNEDLLRTKLNRAIKETIENIYDF